MLSIQKSITLEIIFLLLLSRCTNSGVHVVGSPPLIQVFILVNLDIDSYNSIGNDVNKISYWSMKIYLYNQASDFRQGFLFSWSANSHSNSSQSWISFFDEYHINISLKQILVPETKQFFGYDWVEPGLIYIVNQPLTIGPFSNDLQANRGLTRNDYGRMQN